MALAGFQELFERADRSGRPVPVAAVGAHDETVLIALEDAASRGWVEPVLVGDEAEIRRVASGNGISLDRMRVVGTDDPARASMEEVRSGRCAMLMKGWISTPDLMYALLDPEFGLRRGRSIAQVVLLELVRDGRRLLMTDTGILIHPSVEQKLEITRSAVGVARALGVNRPRVALVTASDTANTRMPETVEAAEIQRRASAGEVPGADVQGPLSFDLAYSLEASERKRIHGPVVGAADILVFPNLLAANLTVKAMMYTAECRFGGILSGASCPVAFMSRADTVDTRLRSLALALAALGSPSPEISHGDQ